MASTETAHPLEAVPLRSGGTCADTRPDGGCLLRMPLTPTGRFHRLLARWLGRQEVRLLLDERGHTFWRQIDEARTLGEISRQLAADFKAPEADCRRAVVRYTVELVRRGFLHLSIPNPKQP